MRTKSQTTYILLERGTEDIELRNELLKVQVRIAKDFKSGREYIKAFPKIMELRQALDHEIQIEDYFGEVEE